MMYHNPFSKATKQPKIPDGKVTESLGFSTQAVLETQAIDSGNGILHFLLFPGQDCALVVSGDTFSNSTYVTYKYLNVGFTGSNGINHAGVDGTGGTVIYEDDYANWRVVSAGLKLALLNPAEQDDGWYEACRITERLEASDYILGTKDGVKNDASNGTITPALLLERLKTRELVNERSYTTGLLRSLATKKFELHPQTDDHDMKQQTNTQELVNLDVSIDDTIDLVKTLSDGRLNNINLINRTIDKSFDMVYVRCHGRTNAGSPSRIHCNVISNQEITFGGNRREARFHTGSLNEPMMDAHISAKKSSTVAAVPVDYTSQPTGPPRGR